MSFDTGFPEPLNKNRNTTRRHPDAKVGSDAIIGGDVHYGSVQKRRFTVRHKHTISWGSVDPSDDSDCSSASSMRPGRPIRAASLSNVHPDPSRLPSVSMARRPSPPRRGISFTIDEAVDEEAIMGLPRDALQIANGPVSLHVDPIVAEARRLDGHHHRVGSVDSDISSPTGSGDEAPDNVKEPPRLRRKKSFFTLLRRSTNKTEIPGLDDF